MKPSLKPDECDILHMLRRGSHYPHEERAAAEIERLRALRGDEAVAENARVVSEFAKLRAEIERLRAALKQITSMAESGARAYDDNELRDLLIEIDNHASAAIAKATRTDDE